MNLKDLLNISNNRPDIDIIRDESCEMAIVMVDNKFIMEGNYWDFHPGCHGGWFYDLEKQFGSFESPESLAEVLKKALESVGKIPRIVEGLYSYGKDPLDE